MQKHTFRPAFQRGFFRFRFQSVLRPCSGTAAFTIYRVPLYGKYFSGASGAYLRCQRLSDFQNFFFQTSYLPAPLHQRKASGTCKGFISPLRAVRNTNRPGCRFWKHPLLFPGISSCLRHQSRGIPALWKSPLICRISSPVFTLPSPFRYTLVPPGAAEWERE